MASLVIASVARKIARRPADARMTFDYGRIEIVAALINYPTLILNGIYLIYEGGMRMIDPPEVAGWTVVILGGVALVIDTLTAGLTYSMQKGSVNIRALLGAAAWTRWPRWRHSHHPLRPALGRSRGHHRHRALHPLPRPD